MLGDRIRLARKGSGYSLRALSAAIAGSASAQMLSRYERNESTPNSDVLLALAEALDVTVEYLIDRWGLTLGDVEFRADTNASEQDQHRVEVEVLSWLDRYLWIEAIVGIDAVELHSPLETQPPQNGDVDVESLAESLRNAWGLGTDPVPNMTELFESRGLRVLCIPMAQSISGLTCIASSSSRDLRFPAIVVNQTHTLERRRFTLAHELGHRLNKFDGTDSEQASTRFAGAFLMPREHLLREFGEHRNSLSYQELVRGKRIYRVSGAALLNRLRELNVITQSTLTYLFQTIARDWRQSEPEEFEPPDLRGRFEYLRRFESLCLRAVDKDLISLYKVALLLEKDESTIIDMLEDDIIERGATANATNGSRHISPN